MTIPTDVSLQCGKMRLFPFDTTFSVYTSRIDRIRANTLMRRLSLTKAISDTPFCSQDDFRANLMHADLLEKCIEYQQMWNDTKTTATFQFLFPPGEVCDFERFLRSSRVFLDRTDPHWQILERTRILVELLKEYTRRQEDRRRQYSTSMRLSTPPENANLALDVATFNMFNRGDGSQTDMCCICHECTATDTTLTVFCGHSFHEECIKPWFRKQSSCPECRAQFETCSIKYNIQFADQITRKTHRGVKRKEPT